MKRNEMSYLKSWKKSTKRKPSIIGGARQVGRMAPVEVKAEENLQAKSLRVYCQKHTPELAIRTSMSDFREEEWMTNLPLYAIQELFQLKL